MDTDRSQLAKLRLADERVKIERGRLAETNVASGTGTMGEIAEIFLTRLATDRAIKPMTRAGYQVVLATLRRAWPDFDRTAPDRITKSATIAWRDRLAANGTGHRPPGAKSDTKFANGSSSAHINKILDILRRLLEIAAEKGQVAANPLTAKGVKLSAKSKKVNLPDPTAINSLFAEIERRGKLGGRGGRIAWLRPRK